ncbi:MAG: Ldh family oxidoreductase [Proteobacteria bacterium]|nr:Ldh family oxidoreductase [Pseudomonadota bacterium]
MEDPRYGADALVTMAHALLRGAGVRDDIARDVAEVLVEADLMGHDTHGLALLSAYLAELRDGRMARDGKPTIVKTRAATELWDGARLPGPWLVRHALETAAIMALGAGTGTVVIRRSHHIACLAAYLPPLTARGLMALIYCSDPSAASVAPFGGITPVFTPDPFAAGIPNGNEPILLDISASYTTNGMTQRLHKAGQELPHPWVQDAKGVPTRDPAVLFADPPGTLLPLGGLEAGHKGYALALLVEALTGGLAGFGRADPREGWGATVFIQVIDPDAFGGRDAMARQTAWLADACHAATPREGVERVRLPGERALRLAREQREHGVRLQPTILPALAPWLAQYGVAAAPALL